MSHIKISHETPISLLEESLTFNDYNYCLVHLFETHPEYYNFYRRCVLEGKEVLLDNSIFELSKAFESKRFAYWVEKLSPDYYIVPDSLENYQETVNNYERFIKEYSRLPGKKIGVIQGKNYQELVDCYKSLLDLGVDKLAISFDYSYYNSLSPKLNKLEGWVKGRQSLIDNMLEDGIIDEKKEHHLLGCGLPQEFKYYNSKDYSFIKSLDTSNPIVSGVFKIKYQDHGLDDKPKMKLFQLIDLKLDEEQLEIVKCNIKKFKSFIK